MLTVKNVKLDKSNCESCGFQTVIVSLIGRFEELKHFNQQNIRKTSILTVDIADNISNT
jgi:hypothetical protein